MKKQEKDQKVYQIYATLGELSVLKKQTEQRLELINKQIDEFEKQLVETLNTKIEEEPNNKES